MLHNEMDQDVHEHYIISFYEKTIVQGKFTILGLNIMHPHKSGFPLRFLNFCTMKGAKSCMNCIIGFSKIILVWDK